MPGKKEYNYSELGLICGLECHQQLDTGKLYCRCPSKMREDKPDFTFKRKIRPVPSELGEYDQAAVEAFKKDFIYTYEAYNDSNCLVETDSEPPRNVNEKALETIFEVALKTNSNILDELFPMRKTIIDGSNVSGFQRTMLVSVGGKLPLKEKEVGIETIILEEDSARLVEKNDEGIVYRLDRLGIPLIELATAPELHTPEEAKECAFKIGELFRITGNAKRGLGSIRQDLNISIKGGARVEVKGVQDIEIVDEYIKKEIDRQLALLEIKKELKARNANPESLKPEFLEITNLLEKSQSKMIKSQLAKKHSMFAVALPKFSELLGKKIQGKRTFGKELANYVKAKTNLMGIIHSDELPAYGITENETRKIEKKLGVKEKNMDAFTFVIGNKLKCLDALNAVISRCKYAFEGIPMETRGALENGETEYQRPLGGEARMYPETDLENIIADKEYLKKLETSLPLWSEERKKKYIEEYKIHEKLADEMKLNNYARFFEELVDKGYDATTSAVILLENLTQLKRENIKVENISKEMIEDVLKALKEEKITKEVINDILKAWSKQGQLKLEDIIKGLKIEKVEDSEVKEKIAKLVERNKNVIKEKKEHATSALMGDAMKEFKGKISGKELAKLLREEMEKYL